VRLAPGEQSPMTARNDHPQPTWESGIGSGESEMPATPYCPLPTAHCRLSARQDLGVQWCTNAGISPKKCHLVPLSRTSKSTFGPPILGRKSFQDHHLECVYIHPSKARTRGAPPWAKNATSTIADCSLGGPWQVASGRWTAGEEGCGVDRAGESAKQTHGLRPQPMACLQIRCLAGQIRETKPSVGDGVSRIFKPGSLPARVEIG
jgi:hypothetical protein